MERYIKGNDHREFIENSERCPPSASRPPTNQMRCPSGLTITVNSGHDMYSRGGYRGCSRGGHYGRGYGRGDYTCDSLQREFARFWTYDCSGYTEDEQYYNSHAQLPHYSRECQIRRKKQFLQHATKGEQIAYYKQRKLERRAHRRAQNGGVEIPKPEVKEKPPTPPWWNEDIKLKTQEKKRAYRKLQRHPTEENKQKHREISKIAQRAIRKRKLEYEALTETEQSVETRECEASNESEDTDNEHVNNSNECNNEIVDNTDNTNNEDEAGEISDETVKSVEFDKDAIKNILAHYV